MTVIEREIFNRMSKVECNTNTARRKDMKIRDVDEIKSLTKIEELTELFKNMFGDVIQNVYVETSDLEADILDVEEIDGDIEFNYSKFYIEFSNGTLMGLSTSEWGYLSKEEIVEEDDV